MAKVISVSICKAMLYSTVAHQHQQYLRQDLTMQPCLELIMSIRLASNSQTPPALAG